MNFDPKQCGVGEKPRSDDGYFEKMIRTMFQSGISWKVIDSKWEGFRKAFENFSIDALPNSISYLKINHLNPT